MYTGSLEDILLQAEYWNTHVHFVTLLVLSSKIYQLSSLFATISVLIYGSLQVNVLQSIVLEHACSNLQHEYYFVTF